MLIWQSTCNVFKCCLLRGICGVLQASLYVFSKGFDIKVNIIYECWDVLGYPMPIIKFDEVYMNITKLRILMWLSTDSELYMIAINK